MAKIEVEVSRRGFWLYVAWVVTVIIVMKVVRVVCGLWNFNQ
jgi:hypothetical protein